MLERLYSCTVASAAMGLFKPIISKPFPAAIKDVMVGLVGIARIAYQHGTLDIDDILRYTEGAMIALSSNALIVGLSTYYDVPITQAITQASYLTTALSFAAAQFVEYYDGEEIDPDDLLAAIPARRR